MTSPRTAGPIKAGLSPLTVARMLWKQKLLAAAIFLGLSAVTMAVVQKLPATYKAETVLLVDSQKIPEKFVNSTVNAELQDRLATIRQTILSNSRLMKIIQTFNLYREERKRKSQEEIIEQMTKDVQITLEKGWSPNHPGAFRISYQGANPTVVAEVANQLANLFVDENLQTREVQAQGTSEFIKSQLEQARKSLDEQEEKVSKYKLKHNGQLPQQEAALEAALGRMQTELEGNQDAINRAQQNKVMLETSLNMAESAEASLNSYLQDLAKAKESDTPGAGPSEAAAKPKKSEQAEAELKLLLAKNRENHPDVRNMRAYIAQLKDEEKKEEEQAKILATQIETGAVKSPRLPAPPDPSRAQQRERIADLRSQLLITNKELETRAKDRERILRNIAGYQARLETLPIREQEMAAVTRDYEMSKANYKSLLDKIFAADMAAEMERRQKAERFTVLDRAGIPEKPFKPNRPLLDGIGCFLSLAMGLGVALGREFRKNAFLGEWELPNTVPVLGRVPSIRLADAFEPSPGRKVLRFALVSSALLSVIFVTLYLVLGRV